MSLTMTDMFCGAGGSSTGATMLPGISVKTALNHWDKALESHNANHPDTIHVQADIKETDPRYIGNSDILWASPECTNHSVAKGRKRVTNQPDMFGDNLPDEAADRSRATMWDVPRFAEVHHYRAIITENVVDAAKWVMFEAWLLAMKSLGYEHRIQYLNSMHAQHGGLPAPQSRDRMYVLFWKKGNKAPDVEKYFRPKAYCSSCDEVVDAMQVFKKVNEPWGRYRAQYVYRCPKTTCKNAIVEPGWLPASAAIDWSLRGERIGDRKRPLAPKTMARIVAGLAKYGQEPVSIDSVRGSQILSAVNHEPFQTQTTAYTRSLLVPVEGREGKQAQLSGEPMRTQTTRNETGLLVPAGGTWNDDARPTSDTMRALTTRDANALVTGPRDHMLMEYYGNGQVHHVSKAIPTITTHDRFAMITTLRGQNAPKDVGQPLDTFAANGLHHGLAEWRVPDINDCEFRMLEPHEIKAGMAFPKEYIMLGNKREQVKMAGNAVTPPAARDLVACMAETLQAV
ncbi:DNA cytosine methyltransferase [Pseudarthrobacter sp. LT1]|uniref:DNA cytosine methyltransferase n=1 Tax=Pseudarthrobacter sp. LT1 TaxID=3111450 RepID=UPI002D76E954|nr:DNA cytosine methyltransferase [Pseudarthrobacter sp. LT1]WRT14682.1 DNA cytosine methyltransferase [Pseudarthrobacter sp. LT1]